MHLDARGLPLSTASAKAVAAYDHLVTGYLTYRVDTPASLTAVLEADPDFALAHCMQGYFRRNKWDSRRRGFLSNGNGRAEPDNCCEHFECDPGVHCKCSSFGHKSFHPGAFASRSYRIEIRLILVLPSIAPSPEALPRPLFLKPPYGNAGS